MHLETTNLLPEDRMRTLRREYFLRLVVVALILGAVVIALSACMLFPTHVFLDNEIAAKEQELRDVVNSTASADEMIFEARLKALSIQTSRITELSKTSSLSAGLAEVLALPHPGVILTGFTLTPAGKNPRTIIVLGKAKSRDDLRNYQLALQSAPFIASANLPVSAYAKDTDIDFLITLAFTKKP